MVEANIRINSPIDHLGFHNTATLQGRRMCTFEVLGAGSVEGRRRITANTIILYYVMSVYNF